MLEVGLYTVFIVVPDFVGVGARVVVYGFHSSAIVVFGSCCIVVVLLG